jgi:hypothetical protein
MMKTRGLVLVSVVFLMLFGTVAAGLAADVTLTLTRTTDYSRTDFGTAYMMVWSGDVQYQGTVVGEFNAVLTKTTTTGTHGYATQYDFVLPGAGAIGEYVSIRTNHVVTGSGADHGTVIATSPALKMLLEATVVMTGDSVTITY